MCVMMRSRYNTFNLTTFVLFKNNIYPLNTLCELMVQDHPAKTRQQCVRRCHLKYFPLLGGGYIGRINFHFTIFGPIFIFDKVQ